VNPHTSHLSAAPPAPRVVLVQRRRWLLARAAAVALAAGLAAGCDTGRAEPAPSGLPPAPVQLALIRPVPIEDASEYLGAVQSLSSTSIKPEVSGEVTRIYVKSGARVTRGAALFLIDPRRQEASVSSQDAARAAQEAAANSARQQLERARTLLAAGAISQQEFDQAQANYDSARSRLASLSAQLQQGRVTLR
jgi:multidrug efflux pump subunit AcrA (membrane-fusion protein)